MKSLSFNIKVMKALILWHDEPKVSLKFVLKLILLMASFMPCIISLTADLVLLISAMEDINGILNVVISLVAICAMIYMSQCFIKNLYEIRDLIDRVEGFCKFGAEEVIEETDKKITKYTKGT